MCSPSINQDAAFAIGPPDVQRRTQSAHQRPLNSAANAFAGFLERNRRHERLQKYNLYSFKFRRTIVYHTVRAASNQLGDLKFVEFALLSEYPG